MASELDICPGPPLPSTAAFANMAASLGSAEVLAKQQPQEVRLSMMMSPDDLVTTRDMTGMPGPPAPHSTAATSCPMMNSPQRLLTCAVMGDRPQDSVEVVIQ